jgi:hypothetical protein
MTINFNDVTDTATPTSGTFNTGGNANVKGAGQNFLTQSQTFTAWGVGTVTVTAAATTAPDSTSTASSILSNGTSTLNFINRTASSTLTSTTYTLSVYAKKLDSNFINLTVFDGSNGSRYWFNISTGVLGSTAAVGSGFTNLSGTITSAGNGWYRCTLTATTLSVNSIQVYLAFTDADASLTQTTGKTNYIWGAQLEFGAVANTYVPTTTAAIYGTPTLSLSGVGGLGLQSDGSLYVSPVGTGAIQAQPTTSTTAGGNARGQNAVDWQTSRNSAAQVAGSAFSSVLGGIANTSASYGAVLVGGSTNFSSGTISFLGGGVGNTTSNPGSVLVGGSTNSSLGVYNFVGGGFTNSATSGTAVTTQSATMNGTTAVTLAASNANIKVGQYISGTSIAGETYVAAISGTSLTLSQAATGSSTSTLSFYTPHGVVVGGGNNQATGSYSFIGGGGDAGTAANRNVASGDWSTVAGGARNVASGIAAVISGGGIDSAYNISGNTASGASSAICGGRGHTASGNEATVLGGAACTANGLASVVFGRTSTTRGITGNVVFSGSYSPISGTGSSQTGLLVLARQTTDATATVLTCDSSAAGTQNQVIMPNNSAYYFKGSCIANVTGAANGAAWSFEGAIMRGANAASTVLIDTPSINRVAASAGATTWTIALTADTTNGGLAVTVTGVAATTIRWVAKVETTEVTF